MNQGLEAAENHGPEKKKKKKSIIWGPLIIDF